MAVSSVVELVSRLSINRLATAGALATLIVFALCWAASALGIVGSRAFVGLFTLAPVQSGTALWMGGVCALVFGAIAGGLIALCYNLTRPRLAL